MGWLTLAKQMALPMYDRKKAGGIGLSMADVSPVSPCPIRFTILPHHPHPPVPPIFPFLNSCLSSHHQLCCEVLVLALLLTLLPATVDTAATTMATDVILVCVLHGCLFLLLVMPLAVIGPSSLTKSLNA